MSETRLALEAAVIAVAFYVLFALFSGFAAQVSRRTVRSWPVGGRQVPPRYRGKVGRRIALGSSLCLAGLVQVILVLGLLVTPFGIVGRVFLLLEVCAAILWTVHLVRLPVGSDQAPK